MKYYLISGEPSGDLHAANLIQEIQKADPGSQFRYYGGDNMERAGGTLVKHYRELAIMGIWEVIKSLKKFSDFIKDCRNDILNYKPDVVILIDYAGFNLRIAKLMKEAGIPVYYYITPKIWAWGKSRYKKIKKNVDKVIVILPFEIGFYKKLGIKADYFGNPVIDHIDSFNKNYTETRESFLQRNNLEDKPIFALLAGSRKQEIDLCLPEMLEAAQKFNGYQFVIAGAPSVSLDYYSPFIENTNIKIVYDQTYPLLKHSFAAVVTSGTATLETALMNVPEVVIYKTSNASFYIGQILILFGVIHVKFFSLVNIILDREVVKELLQFRLSKNIYNELLLLIDGKHRNSIIKGYDEIKTLLENPGVSERVANFIVDSLNKKSGNK